MMERIKIKKVIAVVFLTVLIWVWSDLALDDTSELSQIPVVLGSSSDPNLLVSFVDDAGRLTDHIMIDMVSIKGPAGKIEQIKTQERADLLNLQLLLEPDSWELTEPMEATPWSLVNFVKRSPSIGNRGLSIDDCSPRTASISVVQLVRQLLPVQCIDAYGSIVPASVTPSSINMYVPEAWTGDALMATVELTAADLNRAQGETPIDKTPFVDINGRIKTARQPVKVLLSQEVTNLKSQFIDQPKFCLVVDPVVQRDYVIEMPPEVETPGRIHFKGTDEAKRAYQNEPYHVELVVERKAGPQSQTLKYRFPPEYVKNRQIEPDDSPLATIDFKLVPRESSSENGNPP